MLDNLSNRLNKIVKTIKGSARLSEDNIKDALRQVRIALLEADVALPVVKDFIFAVKEKAIGVEVIGSLTPGQAFIDVVNAELVNLMGKENKDLNLSTTPPAVILMVGLQGVGKTTTVAKLANILKNQKKKVLTVSADIYRPAAIEQLKLLSSQIGVDFFESGTNQSIEEIANSSLAFAKKNYFDVLIVDTAGRIAIDKKMMEEVKKLHSLLNPIETLFIVDSMLGQDSVNTAKAFNESIDLTGIILTKMDGDSRGGAALSVKNVTGKPIKFIGVSEKINGLEAFYPDRMANRILGMGDILGIIDDVKKALNEESAIRISTKLTKGKSFDLNDFKEQLVQMQNMGGIDSLLSKMPSQFNHITSQLSGDVAEKSVNKITAIINSMTPKERKNPQLLKATRKRRIALGAGVNVQDVNKLLNQFEQSQKMMKSITKGGVGNILKMFNRFNNIPK